MYIFWNIAIYDVALRCLQGKVWVYRGLLFQLLKSVYNGFGKQKVLDRK